MARARLLLLTCLLALAPRPARAQVRPTVVAVFEIEDGTKRPKKLVAALTDYLRVKLAERPGLKVVDKGEQEALLRKLIESEKKQSYKACVDSACQIPLGKELAADKILRGKLSRFGKSYVLAVEAIDLASGASAGAASDKSEGTEEALLASVERIALALGSSLEPAAPAPPPEPVPVAAAAPPAAVAMPPAQTVAMRPPPETPAGAMVMIVGGWSVTIAAWIFEIAFTLLKTDATFIYYAFFPIVGPVLVDTYNKNLLADDGATRRGSNPVHFADAGVQLLGAAVAVIGHVWALNADAPATATTVQAGAAQAGLLGGPALSLGVGPGGLTLQGSF